MLIFSSLNSRFHYFLEEFFASWITIKIDRFDFDKDEDAILVIYRIGRQKLAQKLMLSHFSIKYFENLSGFDRQRITKFSTLQDLLTNLFSTEGTEKANLINYIKVTIKNDQLF